MTDFLEAGANAALIKPINRVQLEEVVLNYTSSTSTSTIE